MNRSHFIKTSATGAIGMSLGSWSTLDYKTVKEAVIGHGSHRYKIDLNWGALNPNYYPVNDCHEMVQDKKGHLYLLTNHTKNNILIYNTSGTLVGSWGHEYPGAHGLSIHDENGTEFLYIADNNRHELIKTTLSGRVIQVFPFPAISEKYTKPEEYIPTESCVAPNGDVYVADGYGAQYILHYNAKGELLNVFGGRGTENDQFQNAHGICLDTRSKTPSLLISERQGNELKRFDLQGNYMSSSALPGAYICRPVIHKQEVYLATIWSGDGAADSGFISILNKDNQLISAPGGVPPVYGSDRKLEKMRQGLQVFKHPHDVCIDPDDNLYVTQWNAGKTYPIKLFRV
jgi:DNA-binding beta-propeller fold protein YncE